jgi:hypothetical protein
MGHQAPEGLIGIHTNLLVTALAKPGPAETEEERAAADALATFRHRGFGYFLEQATRPQTIGYALLDSPLGMTHATEVNDLQATESDERVTTSPR